VKFLNEFLSTAQNFGSRFMDVLTTLSWNDGGIVERDVKREGHREIRGPLVLPD
jgi:hypothetical protein